MRAPTTSRCRTPSTAIRFSVNVPNGSVGLAEAGGTQTNLSDYDSVYECVNVAPGNQDAPVSGTGTTITGLDASAGDEWHCTFTNTRKHGDVKVIKDIVPVDGQLGDPGKFDLHIDGEGAYDATKTDAGDGDSVERTVPNGGVNVSEAAGTRTSLSDYRRLQLRERRRRQPGRARQRRGHLPKRPRCDLRRQVGVHLHEHA